MDITKYDARKELSDLMNAPLSPTLSKKAENILEKFMASGRLTDEQAHRLSIQLSLLEELGILELSEKALYPDNPDSDASILTMLAMRFRNRAKEKKQAEEAKKLVGISKKLTGDLIFSRQPFRNYIGGIDSGILEENAKDIISAGGTLLGNRIGLSGGSKLIHAYKMYLGKELSRQSAIYGTTSYLGGIPPEICEEKFNYIPPRVKNRFGEVVNAPTIVIQPIEAARAAWGMDTMSGKDLKKSADILEKLSSNYYLRKVNDNRIEGTPVIISKKLIIERRIEREGRTYTYMVLSLNPDFSTEIIETENGKQPKDYISIEAEKINSYSGGLLYNALFDYVLFHSNKSGIHKVKRDILKAILVEQCPDYKIHPSRFKKDFATAVTAIVQTSLCRFRLDDDAYIVIIYKRRKAPKNPEKVSG